MNITSYLKGPKTLGLLSFVANFSQAFYATYLKSVCKEAFWLYSIK